MPMASSMWLPRLISRPLSRMHNGTLANEPRLTLSSTGAGRIFTPSLPAVAADRGAASDLSLRVELPQPTSQTPLAFEVRVLAARSSAGNATSIMINVTATQSDGVRQGQISATPSFAQQRSHTEAFDVLPDETSLDLRVLIDRSVVEVFVMGGRATQISHDYPAEGDGSGFHLLNWGQAPVTVSNLSIASMGCGWT